MAQVQAHNVGADSLMLPPGLELSCAAQDATAAALQKVEHILNQLGDTVNREAVMEIIREVVQEKIDARIASKAEELWVRARQMISQMQQRHKETTGRLVEEVALCRERQRALEAENGELRRGIGQLAAQLGLNSDATAPAVPVAEATVPSTSVLKESAEPFTPGRFAQAAEAFTSSSPEAHAEVPGSWGMKLPEVPEFPFPAAMQAPPPMSPATPLSLAEALGAQEPQPPPAFLADALAAPHPLAVAGHGGSFGAEAGPEVVPGAEGLWPENGCSAWGGPWIAHPPAEEPVISGGARKEGADPAVLCGQTTGSDCALSAPWSSKPSTLRADASVFVPMRMDFPSAHHQQDEAAHEAAQ